MWSISPPCSSFYHVQSSFRLVGAYLVNFVPYLPISSHTSKAYCSLSSCNALAWVGNADHHHRIPFCIDHHMYSCTYPWFECNDEYLGSFIGIGGGDREMGSRVCDGDVTGA